MASAAAAVSRAAAQRRQRPTLTSQ
jgi:hypothetical protein